MEDKKTDIEYMIELAMQGNVDAVKALFFTIASSGENFSLDQLVEIYFTAYRYWFSMGQHADDFDIKILMFKAYEKLVKISEKNADPVPTELKRGNLDREIVILTQCFLDVQHAPTLSVLNYCINLKSLGLKPVIVNTDTYAIPKCYFNNSFIATSIKKMQMPSVDIVLGTDRGVEVTANGCGASTVTYQGHKFDYFHLFGWYSEKIFHFFRIFQGIIEGMLPVISVGDANPFADLLAKYTKTVVCHTSVEVPVMTIYATPVILKKMNDDDHRIMDRLGISNRVVETELPYYLKNNDRKNLLEIDGGPIRFAIVGRRLDMEIGPEFIDLMAQIKQSIPDAEFVFAGMKLADGIVDLISEIGMSGCVKQVGFVSNTATLYEKAHFFLNPFRKGGGTSAFEALYQGVPVLTLRYGDVYSFVGDDMSFARGEEILAYLINCVRIPGFYADQKERAKKMAETVSNGVEMYRKFLVDVGIAI